MSTTVNLSSKYIGSLVTSGNCSQPTRHYRALLLRSAKSKKHVIEDVVLIRANMLLDSHVNNFERN